MLVAQTASLPRCAGRNKKSCAKYLIPGCKPAEFLPSHNQIRGCTKSGIDSFPKPETDKTWFTKMMTLIIKNDQDSKHGYVFINMLVK